MPKESDWKKYRKRIEEWRERYLRAKNKEIVNLLIDESETPTDRFWNAKGKMKEEAKILNDCLGYHSRSKMFQSLFLMYRYGLVEEANLQEFSEELRDQILELSRGFGR